MTNHAKGLLLGLASTLVWGSQYSAARFIFGEAGDAIDPLFMSMVKFVFGALALLPLLAYDNGWKRCAQAVREDGRRLVAMAVLGGVLEGTLAFYSLKYTTAARSSLLCNMSPIWTVIIAAFATRKWPHRQVGVGMVIGFAGLALALSSHSVDNYTHGMSTLPGDVMAILSGVAWAAYTVFGVDMAKKYGGIPSTVLLLVIATIVMQPVCYFRGYGWITQVSIVSWLTMAFLGVMATGMGIACWYTALKFVPPESLGGYGYLSACIAMVLAKLTANELFPWQFFAAAALIMGGLYLMSRDHSVSQ